MQQPNLEEYNEDELVPPDWLNEDFILEMLAHRQPFNKASLKIWNLLIRPASFKGDHFASLLFRATYEYSNAEESAAESVIIKAMPAADTPKGCIFSETPIFETEHCIYSEVIPAFEQLWRQHGEDIKFAGRLLYATAQPVRIIVLEDLSPLGYVTLRGRPFKLNEVHALLSKLAKWHAISHKLASEPQPEPQWSNLVATIARLQHGLFKIRQLMTSSTMANGMRTLIAVLEEECGDVPVYAETYLPKLRALEPQLVARCTAMQEAYAAGMMGPIYVLNHGDFHANNIMFRPGSNGVEDAEEFLFLDFQFSFSGTSTYDVRFALYTLVGQELRDSYREELLAYYFECFLNSLKTLKLRCKLPNYDDFKNDWLRWRCYELYCICTVLPMGQCAEGTAHEVDLSRVFSCDEYRKTLFKHPRYMDKVKRLLPKLLSMGYLDLDG